MKRLLLIAALLLGSAAPAAAFAQEPSYRGEPGAAPAAHQVPLAHVIAAIAKHTPGRQLNTTVGESGGRSAYFVQWQRAKDGHVVVFVVDAESGQVIGQQGG
jgi:uncharacterized membrane protein YkoI